MLSFIASDSFRNMLRFIASDSLRFIDRNALYRSVP